MSSVDVIVPCYRYGQYLRQCVQSVLDQRQTEVRVLIIDDQSPDNTPEVGRQLARDDARVSYRRHDQNRGHIATYNEGIDWAEAEYLLLLSADDYLLPGALARATTVMDSDPTMALCFGDALELLPDESLVQARMGMALRSGARSWAMPGLEFIEATRRCGSTNIVPTPTAVVRTALQKRLGGYRPQLPHSGDLELWLRLAAHGSVGFVDTNQAVYRRHAANMSLAYLGESRLLDLCQRRDAIECFYLDCKNVLPNPEALREALLESLAREAVGYASAAFNHDRADASQQLSEFASELHPGVRCTLPWLRLACKRGIGKRASRALLPTVDILRRTVTRVFD